jgi:hypothetical protein
VGQYVTRLSLSLSLSLGSSSYWLAHLCCNPACTSLGLLGSVPSNWQCHRPAHHRLTHVPQDDSATTCRQHCRHRQQRIGYQHLCRKCATQRQEPDRAIHSMGADEERLHTRVLDGRCTKHVGSSVSTTKLHVIRTTLLKHLCTTLWRVAGGGVD